MIARPKGRGIETQKLEESQLLIFVQLLVLPPLVFHVLPDRVFIAVLADRACEIPIRPKLAAPQLLPHLRASLEYLARRHAFDYRHDFRHAVGGNRLHQKMNMVLVRAYLQKLQLIARLKIEADIPQDLVHMLIENRSPVFCRKNQMIQQRCYVVAFMDILAHREESAPQAAGNSTRKRIDRYWV